VQGRAAGVTADDLFLPDVSRRSGDADRRISVTVHLIDSDFGSRPPARRAGGFVKGIERETGRILMPAKCGLKAKKGAVIK
jgi:hypothetical protein